MRWQVRWWSFEELIIDRFKKNSLRNRILQNNPVNVTTPAYKQHNYRRWFFNSAWYNNEVVPMQSCRETQSGVPQNSLNCRLILNINNNSMSKECLVYMYIDVPILRQCAVYQMPFYSKYMQLYLYIYYFLYIIQSNGIKCSILIKIILISTVL